MTAVTESFTYRIPKPNLYSWAKKYIWYVTKSSPGSKALQTSLYMLSRGLNVGWNEVFRWNNTHGILREFLSLHTDHFHYWASAECWTWSQSSCVYELRLSGMMGRTDIKIRVKEKTCFRCQPVGVLESILDSSGCHFQLRKKKNVGDIKKREVI